MFIIKCDFCDKEFYPNSFEKTLVFPDEWQKHSTGEETIIGCSKEHLWDAVAMFFVAYANGIRGVEKPPEGAMRVQKNGFEFGRKFALLSDGKSCNSCINFVNSACIRREFGAHIGSFVCIEFEEGEGE